MVKLISGKEEVQEVSKKAEVENVSEKEEVKSVSEQSSSESKSSSSIIKPIPKFKDLIIEINTPLLTKGVMEVTKEDLDWYFEEIEEFKLKNDDYLAPFIIYLNSRFKTSLHGRLKKKRMRLILFLVLVLSLLLIGYGLIRLGLSIFS